jgi:hypothetical protein
MNLNEIFDAVIVLNLDRRPDRLESITYQLNKLDTTFYRWPAIDNVNTDMTPIYCNLMNNMNRLLYAKYKEYKTVLFLDDDVVIPTNYVEQCLSYFEPNSYKSAYAWKFLENGQNYYRRRVRVTTKNSKVHYCGTAVSVIDAKIFLNDDLLFTSEDAYQIEDLWMSYYANHILGWKLAYIPIQGLSIGGNDPVALSKVVKRNRNNKAVFLRKLVSLGWKLETEDI